MMHTTTRLTSAGELSLPKDLRDFLKIDGNAGLVIYLEDNQIVLKKVNKTNHQSLRKPSYR
jgi:bifunctional DNA-binding transcriptional regulator/antitoxin component of YhaV-PrlF toxin-antitoxin module